MLASIPLFPLRSGLWEVDLLKRVCRPCYWSAPGPIRVVRSTWFCCKSGEWLPCGCDAVRHRRRRLHQFALWAWRSSLRHWIV